MNKIQLPKDQYIIVDIYKHFHNEVFLCGSGVDYFYLNKPTIEIKDLDFITTNPNINTYANTKLIKLPSKIFNSYIKYVGHWNYKYLIEIFVVNSITNDDIYVCEKLKIPIESLNHRYEFITQTIKHNWIPNKHNQFLQLQQDYLGIIK